MEKRIAIINQSFAQRVYDALMQIPEGRVMTYTSLAKLIGHPKACRAVGTALGRNPNAPQVPCHRVVRSDGSLGGYAFGLKKKRALLKQEGVPVVDGRVNLSEYSFDVEVSV